MDTTTHDTADERADSSLLDRFDINIVQTITLVGVFALLASGPYWAGTYTYSLALASIWAIFAMGWDILSGYTRYISFGHTLLSGGAAYATALLLTYVDPSLSLAITVPISIIAALVIGLLFALPSLRLQGPYFSLITLVGVLIAVRLVFMLSDITGGELGLNIGAITYDSTEIYYFTFVPMVLVAVALVAVSKSNIGMVFKGIGENESAIEAAGLDTTKFKLWAFVISAIPMGLGGTLIAHFYGSVDPGTVLAVNLNIEIIAMAVIGGMGTVLGSIGGAFFFVLMRDEILLGPLGSHMRYVVLWIIVLAIFLKFPSGLFVRIWDALGNIDFGGDD
ncbi:MAG: branched-chain amino acid ABC transporter permease [Natronomonas sp.]